MDDDGKTARLIPPLTLIALLGIAGFAVPARPLHTAAGQVAAPWPHETSPTIDGAALDRLMARLPLDSQGQLIRDARTVEALGAAADGFGESIDDKAARRLRFLLSKGLPGPAGDQAGDLLLRYNTYRLALGERASPVSQAERERLQRRVFGVSDAEALFRQHNAMMKALAGEPAP
ncbi:hypothetical protein [Marinobacter sp. JSM 1782161]|uniref:hypothetical protein n=1 Tax=Marinobacter sp. JSM 1782161 TaxID=2685906 RepID=UPI001402751D|nr:hypothetical protein [Marinobacter sp. JSM 1782161]